VTAVLSVPAPALAYEDAGGGAAALELPVSVLLGPVTATGAGPGTLGPAALSVFGYLVQRRTAPGILPELWDDTAKAWVPDGPGAAVPPVPLAHRDGEPRPWLGLLVAGGATDAAGAPAYAKARGGYPLYSVRGCFAGLDGHRVTGPPGPNLTFVSAADRNLLVIGPGDDEKPESATEVRMLLKDAALRVIGGLTVSRGSPGAEVRLRNSAGAEVVLRADGSIELRPAAGHGVVVAGDLETEHLTYRPAGGAIKRTLG
jgi:hypothetical protein